MVAELRRLGHDVVTSLESGNAGRAVPDPEVLAFAVSRQRVLVTPNRRHSCESTVRVEQAFRSQGAWPRIAVLMTLNRRHFIRLHHGNSSHFGIIVCTFDPAFEALARRINDALIQQPDKSGQLVRINRPG